MTRIEDVAEVEEKSVIRRPTLPVDKYTTISNAVVRDSAISFKARGIYAYLASHVDGWETSVDRIAEAGGCGRDAVMSGLRELRSSGYLELVRQRDDEKRFAGTVYTLREPNSASTEPKSGFQGTGFQATGFQGTGNPTYKEDQFQEDHLKEDQTNLSPSPSSGTSTKRPDPKGAYTDDFEAWYSTYPRRQAKRAAFQAFVSAVFGAKGRKPKIDYEELLVATKRFAESRVGQDQSLTPHPSTWLNQERWADEPVESTSKGIAGFDWGTLK